MSTPFRTWSVLCALFAVAPVALATEPAGGFVESPLQPGIFHRISSTSEGVALGGKTTLKASAGVRAIPGLKTPGAVIRSGNTLYVANNPGSTPHQVTEIDISVPGSEFIVGTITTPVNPVDLAVTAGSLYVIDQNRDKLYYRPLVGGIWNFIQLPAATTEWEYGNILFPHDGLGKMFVIHFWENQIHVVNLTTGLLETTITNLHHLPNRIRFVDGGDRMVVLGVGLDAPSCSATGPHFAVFDLLNNYQKLFEVDLSGNCAQTIANQDDALFAVRDADILGFDALTGAATGSLGGLVLGRHAEQNGARLFVQNDAGDVQTVDLALTGIEATYDLLQGPQVWYPPLEEMVALDFADGRVFATNRNDGTLSIIDWPPCFTYGGGCAGSAGLIPELSATGCPISGAVFNMDVSNGLGGAQAFLFLGTDIGSIALEGNCTFLLSPVLPPLISALLTGTGPGNGALSMAIPVPVAIPQGLIGAVQFFVIDPGSPVGYSATNGLHFRTE